MSKKPRRPPSKSRAPNAKEQVLAKSSWLQEHWRPLVECVEFALAASFIVAGLTTSGIFIAETLLVIAAVIGLLGIIVRSDQGGIWRVVWPILYATFILALGVSVYIRKPEHARIDVTSLTVRPPTTNNGASANFYISNTGKIPATSVRHFGVLIVRANKLHEEELDKIFESLYEGLRPMAPSSSDEMRPGADNIFFSLPDRILKTPDDNSIWNDMNDGSLAIYFIMLIEYQDFNIKSNRWHATESCYYMFAHEKHVCESHNRVVLISE